MTIRLTTSNPECSFKDDGTRKRVATAVARCVDCAHAAYHHDGLPYTPNKGDTSFWAVDGGNDWKVQFHAEAPLSFDLLHRYSQSVEVQQRMIALAHWLAAALNCKVEVSA